MHEVKAPSVGESITEVRIGRWIKQEGEVVRVGEPLLEIESDKATVEVVSEVAGKLHLLHAVGDTVKIGALLAKIDDSVAPTAKGATASSESAKMAPASAPNSVAPTATAPLSPAVRKAVAESGVDPAGIAGTGKGGRITKGDLLNAASGSVAASSSSSAGATPIGSSAALGTNPGVGAGPVPGTAAAISAEGERRVPMTLLRQKIAERLVQAQHTAAILTTFNECDMTAVNAVRAQHKESFKAKHGVPLSFMSFFARACVLALKEVPAVNAMIDGKDMVFRDYVDIGVAVGTERGLVVPVIRGIGQMTFVDIEKAIGAMALRAREGKLSIKELSGGTFTISNGGTYGSLLSTPILNPPQSGILGMHKIQDRPIAVDGRVEIRPMMYLALSYDHRIIDGKEAVTFLVKVKEGIEQPQKLGMDF